MKINLFKATCKTTELFKDKFKEKQKYISQLEVLDVNKCLKTSMLEIIRADLLKVFESFSQE